MDLVLVGRIARTHGLHGEVIVDPETDFPEERFAPGASLLVQRTAAPSPPDARPPADADALQTMRVASVKFHRGRPIVAFEGIGSIEQAEALGRADLWIDAASRAALPAGEFYHDALIGCRVETTGGDVVGTVSRIDGSRGAALLVIARAPGAPGTGVGTGTAEVLVPLAEAICPVIDPAGRRIVIDPPEGLLELNG